MKGTVKGTGLNLNGLGEDKVKARYRDRETNSGGGRAARADAGGVRRGDRENGGIKCIAFRSL